MQEHAEVTKTILSNFAKTPFTWNGERWRTAEHAYQAMKTHDAQHRAWIRDAKTAKIAKHLGGSVKLRPDWERIKEQVMLEVLRAKYTQDAQARTHLLDTGDRPIRETAPWDSYWGTGDDGLGKNRLGVLLMQVRKELQR